MASFAVSLLVFLPTLNFLAPADPNRYWLVNCLLRVTPVVVSFLCLAFYGAALAWRAASAVGLSRPELPGLADSPANGRGRRGACRRALDGLPDHAHAAVEDARLVDAQ